MVMSAGRIEQAMARINAAMKRIEDARSDPANAAPAKTDSSRVMALVNSHEKLREEVADTIGEIDALIAEFEE